MNLLQVKIGDFGLATTNIKLTDLTLNLDRSLTDENQSDMTGQIGTAMYVAPEINAGKVIAAYSQKVDIYSLGVIFFEMCHPPLTTGMERIKILSALRCKSIDLPMDFDLGDQQSYLIKWLLDHDPSLRPTSVELLQVIFCQINMFCHQLTQNMMTDFVRFTKICTNCSDIQNLQNLCFEFQNNLCKSS